MPRSMTGFARMESQQEWGKAICEVRSVNHRYLEPSLRLPDALRHLEPDFRENLRQSLNRGKVEVTVSLKTEQNEGGRLVLNQELADEITRLAVQVQGTVPSPAPLNSLDILRWPGVVQAEEPDQAAVESCIRSLFDNTLRQLIDNREREGAKLGRLIEQRLQILTEQVARLREHLPDLLARQHERLRSKIESLAMDVDEERFAQEVAYLAQKADVAEELDRLDTHVDEVRHTLARPEAVGRRLDFLMQELNREANTLSSKSVASESTQIAVDLKVLIEQMREQVQNIE